MSIFNFAGGSTTVSLLAAASCANTAAATGTGVDLIDYDAPIIITQNHGVSTGTLDGKIQDSADNSSFADISVSGVTATFTQSTTTADVKSLVINPKTVRRYIRYLGTVGTGPQVVGVTMVGIKKTV
jgi:hypothetical protein